HIPFFSRSTWSRAPSVSKKIGRPRGRTHGTRTIGCHYQSPRSDPSRGASDGPDYSRIAHTRQSPSDRNVRPSDPPHSTRITFTRLPIQFGGRYTRPELPLFATTFSTLSCP